MADKNTNVNIKVIIDAAESAKTVQQTRQALKDLKSAALQVEEGSDAFVALTRAAGELQDKMGDLSNQTKFFADDMKNLSGLAAIGSGIAGGFNVLQGTMALVAGESEDMQKAMQKVQITMGIVQGLQEVSLLLNKNETAAIFLKSVAMKAASTAQLIYAAAVGTSTGALKAFRLALLATGIGAVIVGIGLLIANWDKLTAVIGKNNDILEENAKANEKANQKIQDKIDLLANTEKTTKRNAEIAEMNADIVTDGLEKELVLMKARNASQVEILKKEKEIVETRKKVREQTLKDNKTEEEAIKNKDKAEKIYRATLEQKSKREQQMREEDAMQKAALILESRLKEKELDMEKRRAFIDAQDKEMADLQKNANEKSDLWNEQINILNDIYNKRNETQNELLRLDIEIENAIREEAKKTKEEQDKLNEERQKRAIELANKTKEERKKILDEEFKDIELYMEKLKLTEQAAFQRFGIPQELLEENINKLKDNAEQEFMLASNLNKSRFELNMRLIEQESKIRSDFRQQQIGEEIRYATMEYEKKREAVKNTIADSSQRNEILTSLEEQHQLNIQRINTLGQNDIVKLTKDTEAKKLAEIRRNQEEEKQIRQQALDVMVQSANEAYDAIAAKVQDTYQQMIDMSNAEYAVRQKNIDREIEDFKNQGKQISIEEQARIDKEAEFQSKKDALEAERAAKEKQLKSEAFEKQRQMDMLAILANTAVAITKQLAATPLPLGAPLIAAIAAQGVIQTAIVASQQPAFAEGGLVSGPGGPKDDKISVRLSNGESVINARSTKMYAPLLSQINQAGGGRAIPHLAAGGIVTNVPSSGMDTSRLEDIMMAMANRPIETYVKEASVTKAQARTVREKKRTSF